MRCRRTYVLNKCKEEDRRTNRKKRKGKELKTQIIEIKNGRQKLLRIKTFHRSSKVLFKVGNYFNNSIFSLAGFCVLY